MLQQTSRLHASADLGSDRSGVWTLEGMSLVILGGFAACALLFDVVRLDQFLAWIYVFVGGVRILSGAVRRGPGLGWMILIAGVALTIGLVLVLRGPTQIDSVAAVLAIYLLLEALLVLGFAWDAGAQLGCRRWLYGVIASDLLLAGVAVAAARIAEPAGLITVVTLQLLVSGATLMFLGYRCQSAATTARQFAPAPRVLSGRSRTYGSPWARRWRE